MLSMLSKYADPTLAAHLSNALPEWEKCAELWSMRMKLIEQLRAKSKQTPHAIDTARLVAHGTGGVDEHGNILAITLQAAHACWHLFITHGDWIDIQGQPLIV